MHRGLVTLRMRADTGEVPRLAQGSLRIRVRTRWGWSRASCRAMTLLQERSH